MCRWRPWGVFLRAFPLVEANYVCRRVSGAKTLAAVQTRQLDLVASAQTTVLAARRVQAQRCKTTSALRFPLVGIGMLKNTYGKWHLSGGRRRRRAHRWPPDNRQTSTPPRRTSFASSGADLKPSSSFQTAPNGYSTSQEPERTFSAAVADALDA